MCFLSTGFHFKIAFGPDKFPGLSRNKPLARRVDQVSVMYQLNNHGLSINMSTVFLVNILTHTISRQDHLSVDISGNSLTNTQPSNVNQHDNRDLTCRLI